jgi:RimJ/RimL family protein N-acetyltransferase
MTLSPGTIRTERLVLSPLVVDDADEMVDVLGDERMYEFTGGEPPVLERLRERYRRLAEGRSPDGSELWFNWIVRLAADRTAVGTVQATVVADGDAAEVAWEVGIPWQGHGLASEAAVGMVDWLIAGGVRSISACVHQQHHASARVAARAGLAPTAEVVDGEIVWRRADAPQPDRP